MLNRPLKTHSISMPCITNSTVEKPRFLKENSPNIQGQLVSRYEKPQFLKTTLPDEKGQQKENYPIISVKQSFTKSIKVGQKKSAISLKERLNTLQVEVAKSSIKVNDLVQKAATGEDILASISVCKSTRYLQKYGCLHKDLVCGRKSTWMLPVDCLSWIGHSRALPWIDSLERPSAEFLVWSLISHGYSMCCPTIPKIAESLSW